MLSFQPATFLLLLFDDDQENYGKPDPANVTKVKALYHEINLQVFLYIFFTLIGKK